MAHRLCHGPVDIGDICQYSDFSMTQNGDPDMLASLASVDASFPHVANQGSTHHAKLEQSMLSFKRAHPDWVPSDEVSKAFLTQSMAFLEQSTEEDKVSTGLGSGALALSRTRAHHPHPPPSRTPGGLQFAGLADRLDSVAVAA